MKHRSNVRYLKMPRDSDKHSRVLTCTDCGDVVRVYEIPSRYLNPRTYRCGLCQTGRVMTERPIPFSEQHPPRRAA